MLSDRDNLSQLLLVVKECGSEENYKFEKTKLNTEQFKLEVQFNSLIAYVSGLKEKTTTKQEFSICVKKSATPNKHFYRFHSLLFVTSHLTL